MKYAIFVLLFLITFALVAAALVPATPGESLAFNIGQIIGLAVVPLLIGCLALFSKWKRFETFALTTILGAGLVLWGAIR